MPKSDKKTDPNDNGGTRLRSERRKNQKSERSPDRKNGRDRRKGYDRRSGLGRRRHIDNGVVERRDIYRNPDGNE